MENYFILLKREGTMHKLTGGKKAFLNGKLLFSLWQ